MDRRPAHVDDNNVYNRKGILFAIIMRYPQFLNRKVTVDILITFTLSI